MRFCTFDAVARNVLAMSHPDDHSEQPSQEQPHSDNVVKFIPRVRGQSEKNQTPEHRLWRENDDSNRVAPSSYTLHTAPFGAKHPPMFNIPRVTKILIMVMAAIEIMVQIAQSFYPQALPILTQILIFIPELWSSGAAFQNASILSPLGSMFAHGGWFHLGINVVSLAAFGSGAEKIYGTKKYLVLFFGSGVVGLLSYFAFYPFATVGVLGASGAISGIFGAVLYNLYAAPRGAQTRGRSGQGSLMQSPLMMICLIYVVISIVSGLIGTPNGQPIAWIAHIGGFLAGIGFAALKPKKQ